MLLLINITELNFPVFDFSFMMFTRSKTTKHLKPVDVAKESIFRGSDPDGTTSRFIDDVIGSNLLSYVNVTNQVHVKNQLQLTEVFLMKYW